MLRDRHFSMVSPVLGGEAQGRGSLVRRSIRWVLVAQLSAMGLFAGWWPSSVALAQLGYGGAADTRIFVAGIGVDVGREVWAAPLGEGELFTPAPGSPHRKIKARALENARKRICGIRFHLEVGSLDQVISEADGEEEAEIAHFYITQEGLVFQAEDPAPLRGAIPRHVAIGVLAASAFPGDSPGSAGEKGGGQTSGYRLSKWLFPDNGAGVPEGQEEGEQDLRPLGPEGYQLTPHQREALTDLTRALVAGVPRLAKARVQQVDERAVSDKGQVLPCAVLVPGVFSGLQGHMRQVLVPKAVLPPRPPRAKR